MSLLDSAYHTTSYYHLGPEDTFMVLPPKDEQGMAERNFKTIYIPAFRSSSVLMAKSFISEFRIHE